MCLFGSLAGFTPPLLAVIIRMMARFDPFPMSYGKRASFLWPDHLKSWKCRRLKVLIEIKQEYIKAV